jgi:membrane-bound serine protease (ClpP class)
MYGLMSLGIAFLVSIGLIIIIVKYFGNRGAWNRLILRDEMKKEQGYISSHSKIELVGKSGLTVTPLRPSGTVLIDGERVDAVTEGGFIPSQKEIVVVKVEGNRIVVREV